MFTTAIYIYIMHPLCPLRPRVSSRSPIEEEKSIRRHNDQQESSSDFISNLPNDISYHILSLLPIESIAQISVLSKRWTYLKNSLPILDFSKVCTLPLTEEKRSTLRGKSVTPTMDYYAKIMAFITSVLARRHEDSNVKVFRIEGDMSCPF